MSHYPKDSDPAAEGPSTAAPNNVGGGGLSASSPCSLLFRSAEGEWKKSALDDGGDGQELQPIVAACCETCGDAIVRHATENGLHWVHRIADWWQNHKAKNAKDSRGA